MINDFFLFFEDECTKTMVKFASLLKLKVTAAAIKKELQEHPDYPSLLSVSDTLKQYGVDNASIKTTIESLEELPTPFIAQINDVKTRNTYFAIVKSVDDKNIEYFEPNSHKWRKTEVSEFAKRWRTGVVLVAEIADQVEEKGYSQKRRGESFGIFARWAGVFLIPLIMVLTTMMSFFKLGMGALDQVLFSWSMFIGCLNCILLMWFEVDQHNPLAKEVCGGGRNLNCMAVLNSKMGSVLGIKWSVAGFAYFTGGLLISLLGGLNEPATRAVFGSLSIAALLYTFFSIYYQSYIVKQWCRLCLGVQFVLLFQATIVLIGNWLPGWKTVGETELFNTGVQFILAFFIPFVLAFFASSVFKQYKEGIADKHSLQRLKYDAGIFNSVLKTQKRIEPPSDEIGIVLGNPEAKHKLINVCSPICGPCAKAHPAVEELLKDNPDVQIRIIFVASNREDDKRFLPVWHFLAIAEGGGEDKLKQALNDWYLDENKEYETFSKKYPVNVKGDLFGEKIEAMHSWCERSDVAFTPTFFLNGYQLPEMYKVTDLKYLLSNG